MTPFLISSEAIIRFISALIAALLVRTAWRRRSMTGASAFGAMVLAAGFWSFITGIEYLSNDLGWRIFWSKFEYLGITSLPQLWLVFTLQFSRRGTQQLNKAMRTPWPYVIPVATLALVFTNEYHGLFWPNVYTTPGPGQEIQVVFEHGLAFYIFVVYSYVLLLAGSLALIAEAANFNRLYKRQGFALLFATAVPWIANFLYISRLTPWLGNDLTPVAFVFSGVILAFGVFRFYLFDVVPVAQGSVVESLPDGVIVIDPQERVAYNNSAAYRLMQLATQGNMPAASQEWTGQKIAHLLQPFPPLLEAIISGKNLHYEIELEQPAYLAIEAILTDVVGPRGEISGRLLTLRDVTERKRVEEQMRLQSVALQSAANAVVITDRNGVIQSINPAFSQITGYTPDEVIGKHPNLLKSGKHDETFYRQLWETIMNDQAWHGELVNRRKDGSLYTEEQTITPVRNASGQVTHFIGIKQDITQRKQLEDMRDDLMKSLVHDLRNPLNSILLSLEMFQMLPENTAVPAPVRTMLGLARNATWRMMGMVNAIMDMSRLESGQLLLDRQPVILVEMVEQAINQQASLATHSEVLLLNAVPYDLPHAFVDAVLITRLFQNLLDNAIKFTPPGGKVEVKAVYDQDGDMLLVSVQDTGAGIPQDILPRVFDKYTTGTSPRRGTGLGLAFCRLAVEAHGGKIWVESQSGEGATFLFTLPVINAFKSSVKNLSVSDSK